MIVNPKVHIFDKYDSLSSQCRVMLQHDKSHEGPCHNPAIKKR